MIKADILSNKLKSLIANFESVAMSGVADMETEIIDANVLQLEKGLNSEGDLFPQLKSDDYADFKKSIGSRAPYGYPDMKVEGNFTGDFKMDNFRLYSDDEKADDLYDKYGKEKIHGLTEDSKEMLKPDLIINVKEKIKNELRTS